MSQKIALLGSFLVLCGGLVLLSQGCGQAKIPASPSVTSSAASHDINDLVGRVCVVHLRYDALGTAGDSPKPAFTDIMNGATVSIRGTLRKIDNNWVVIEQKLESSTQVHWVPVNAILSVTRSTPKEQPNSDAGHGEH